MWFPFLFIDEYSISDYKQMSINLYNFFKKNKTQIFIWVCTFEEAILPNNAIHHLGQYNSNILDRH